MKIKILPSEVANQIAAGEVVERPASVVKELVENSIDAQATNIELYIEKGGKSLIEVRDDGNGMTKEEAEKSILRHATSKIKAIEDIFSIRSFGFRGEALAAISSVSRFKLLTKTESAPMGSLISVSAGKREPTTSAPANQGTQIKIKDLFFPTPARLQYLKTEETEYRAIYKEIISFALAHPTVGFKFFRDGKALLDFPPAQKNRERIQKILKCTTETLTHIDQSHHGMTLKGYVSRPEKAAKTKTHQYFFINGRRIEDFRLAYAAREAYQQSCGIEKHLHPIFVLFLEIDPVLVDVNVHPRKLEVKFSDPQDVYRAIKTSIIQAQEKTEISVNQQTFPSVEKHPYVSTFQTSFTQIPKPASASNKYNAQMLGHETGTFAKKNKQREKDIPPPSFEPTLKPPPNREPERETIQAHDNLRLIGQLANKYILAESHEGFYLFDQHALHERQRFERLLKEAQTQKIQVQNLLIPQIIELPELEYSCLQEQAEDIMNLGFQINFKPPSSIEITALPAILSQFNFKNLFEDFVNYFQEYKVGEHSLEKLLRETLERRSCRGSVMFGDALNPLEMQKLLNDFTSTQWRLLCPHGRPNHIFYSFKDLDQKFHR